MKSWEATHTFQPGSLGIVFNTDTGIVEEVKAYGKAHTVGIRIGDQVLEVDNQPFSVDALLRATNGDLDYQVTVKGGYTSQQSANPDGFLANLTGEVREPVAVNMPGSVSINDVEHSSADQPFEAVAEPPPAPPAVPLAAPPLPPLLPSESLVLSTLEHLTTLISTQHRVLLNELSEQRQLIQNALERAECNLVPISDHGRVTFNPGNGRVTFNQALGPDMSWASSSLDDVEEDSAGDDSTAVEPAESLARVPAGRAAIKQINRRAIIPADNEVNIINTKRSIASLFLGMDSKQERFLHAYTVKRKNLLGKMIGCCWWLGLLTGLCGQLSMFPKWIVYFSILQLPLSLSALLMLCVDTVALILKDVQTYLVIFMQVSLCTAIMFLLQDVRCIFWVCHIPNIILTAFLDAYNARYRPKFLRMFISGCVLAIIYSLVILCLGFVDDIYDAAWTFGSFRGYTTSSMGSTTVALLLHYCRHLSVAFFKLDDLVILRKDMKTVYVDVSRISTNRLKGPTQGRPNGIEELT